MSEANTSPRPDALLRWGIVSTGHIAGVFARDLAQSQRGHLVAVGSRRLESARAFAETWSLSPEHAHGSLEALLADACVDAVYVATPHPAHHAAVIAALQAGKHVLCEKPMAMGLAQVEEMQAVARSANRTLMEARMYRCHPQTQRVVDWVCSGAIGEVRHIQGAFSYHAPFDAQGRLWNKALGGGGILDVGGYPLSYARLIAGAAQTPPAPFLDPISLAGVGTLHPVTGSDTHAAAVLQFAGGITAEIACGTAVQQDNVMRIYGTTGWIHVPSPFVISRETVPPSIFRHLPDQETPETLVVTPDRGLYAYEADSFAAAISAGSLEVPACSWADTRGNIAAQFEWCRQIGLHYA